MNSRSRYLIIIMALALSLSFILNGCARSSKSEAPSRRRGLHEKVDNKIDAYLTDIQDSRDALSTGDGIKKYIISWAENKGIHVKEDDGIVVMNVDCSEEYKDAPPTVLVCPYDEHDFDDTLNPMAMAMYALKNNEDTGRITALFVPETGHDMGYAEKLKKKYFMKGSNVFCLDGDDSAIVSQATGGASHYRFTRKFRMAAPKHQKAYKIVVRGIRSDLVDNKINSKINPIMELNTLLASLKKPSIDFEIASYRGGTIDMLNPGSCSVVLTVDEDKEAAFLKRVNSRIESFNKRKKAADEDAVFAYKEVPLPDKVLDQKDSSTLMSFIYTLLEDEYHRDEDTDILTAVCDVSYIRLNKGNVVIGSTAYSLSDEKLLEIDEAEETLCGLSEFKYEKTHSIPSWEAGAYDELRDVFVKAYDKYKGKDLIVQPSVTPSYGGYITELTDKCDILAVTVSSNTLKDLTGALMEYLIAANKVTE